MKSLCAQCLEREAMAKERCWRCYIYRWEHGQERPRNLKKAVAVEREVYIEPVIFKPIRGVEWKTWWAN